MLATEKPRVKGAAPCPRWVGPLAWLSRAGVAFCRCGVQAAATTAVLASGSDGRVGMSVLLVLCTCPDAASGERIARALVEERLAACVNRVPGLTSVYRWQDAVESAPEELLLIKTTRAAFPALQARLLALHPYALPEVIALPIDSGHAPYLDWVQAAVAPT